jgi:hypothetical protein
LPRKPTAEVSIELLGNLFRAFDLWSKIRSGCLISTPVAEKDAPSHHYPDALSRIVKHRLPNGKHIATTHRIEALSGDILHEDAKDLLVDDVCLWRF